MRGVGGREGERSEPKVPPRPLRDAPVARARAHVCVRESGERPFDRWGSVGRRAGTGRRTRGVVTGTNGPRPRKRCRQRARRCALPAVPGVVSRVPCVCRDCRDAGWRDLKARLHQVGRNGTAHFDSDENDDPRRGDDDTMTTTTTANAVCSGSSNSAVTVCDDDAIVVAV